MPNWGPTPYLALVMGGNMSSRVKENPDVKEECCWQTQTCQPKSSTNIKMSGSFSKMSDKSAECVTMSE